MYQDIAVLCAFLFVYSVCAGRMERTPVAGAIAFTGFGVLSGPLGLGLLQMDVKAAGLRTLAELTLALVLFTDAASADLAVLRRHLATPARLLLLGLPLTIALGMVGGAMLLPGLTIIELAILATMLAPTDAALGKAVITDPLVPAPIRESLNVESGLNDGICVPVLLILLDFASRTAPAVGDTAFVLRQFAEEIGIGGLVGGALAVLGVRAMAFAHGRGWGDEAWRQLPALALALTCFATAQAAGGSGFIACFVGGLVGGAMARRHRHAYLLGAEGAGDMLSLLTWVAFGAAVVGQALGRLTWPAVAYAVLSLTVVRMLPVYLALAGTGLGRADKLFVGWFGPRGLASIVFAVIVIDADLPGRATLTITVACTVILSILAHGLSAGPLAARYAGRGKP